MGLRNYLVEGVSGTGKTSVCEELLRLGHDAVHGDRELAYQGDPVTGAPLAGASHEHHLWDEARVRARVADRSRPATFFCGGSRNFSRFIELFDETFVLEVDRATLVGRLDERPPGEWGSSPSERYLVLELHRTQRDVPATGVRIDATRPVDVVVAEILRHTGDRPGPRLPRVARD